MALSGKLCGLRHAFELLWQKWFCLCKHFDELEIADDKRKLQNPERIANIRSVFRIILNL
jgi:hypothetical protein